jgi:hypothetical protein
MHCAGRCAGCAWLATSLQWLAVLLATLPALAMAGATVEPAGRHLYAQPSPLGALIDRLPELSTQARLDLATLMVESLADAYEAELALAQRESRATAAGQRRLSSWYQATAWTLGEIRRAQAGLFAARHLELHVDARDEIMLLIDGHPLLVAWPRPASQAQREAALAAEFCRLHTCPTTDEPDDAAARSTPDEIHGSWVLEQLRPPTWQSNQGIRCEFDSFSERVGKEQLCRALVVDMQALATALAVALRRGEHIDWTQVGLRGVHAGGRHRVTINARGDYLTAHLPALAGGTIDWREAQPWLEARVQGRITPATVKRATDR